MKYTDGKQTIEAFKWNGNVLAGTEKGVPKWFNDAILVSHEIWFDAAWNMKVRTSDGIETCDVGDYVVRNHGGSLGIIGHEEFKSRFSKA